MYVKVVTGVPSRVKTPFALVPTPRLKITARTDMLLLLRCVCSEFRPTLGDWRGQLLGGTKDALLVTGIGDDISGRAGGVKT